MAPTTDKRSERVVNRLTTPYMTLTITDYQLSRLRNGCSSVPVNKDLVAIGMAHTVYKSVQDNATGDEFTHQVFTQGEGGEEKTKEVRSLVGPTDKLYPDWTRVLSLKQNTKEASRTGHLHRLSL